VSFRVPLLDATLFPRGVYHLLSFLIDHVHFPDRRPSQPASNSSAQRQPALRVGLRLVRLGEPKGM
jgi:hypothetical protein